MVKFRYPCVRVKQAPQAKELLLFSASAIEIEAWVGIPQRLSLGGAETAGFQRTVSPTRELALRKFFADPDNVIQNPLLCAIRLDPGTEVSYVPSEENESLGHVEIKFEDHSKLDMPQLFSAARKSLELRVQSLQNRARPDELIASLQKAPELGAFKVFLEVSGGDEESEDAVGDGEEDEGAEEPDEDGEAAEEALFDESQVTDFWDHLRAREEIAAKLTVSPGATQFLGFSRRLLESYLQPVVLVDGQHRLTGAVLAAQDEVDKSEAAKNLVIRGMSANEARQQLLVQVAKHLPISLLMNSSAAEHVFQYVLVNQKATPVPKALLGTIISTSLVADELSTIATRLEHAKIPLEGSRIVSILSRSADSPFKDLVAKGMHEEGTAKLQWSVLSSLADVFRYLEGGRYYHEPSDHAKTWRTHHLEGSSIVAEWQVREFASPYEYWQDLDGPWLKVFKAFWTSVRDALANATDGTAKNFWGEPRESNIFNKPSLHILTADFFNYLNGKKAKIDSPEQISTLVDDWLEYTSKQYFARDWKLSGVKKDSVGTRRQWSRLWSIHRQNGGNPPAPAEFSKLLKA